MSVVAGKAMTVTVVVDSPSAQVAVSSALTVIEVSVGINS